MTSPSDAARPHADAVMAHDEFAGLRRELEIALRLAPTRAAAVPALRSLAAYLDSDATVPVRIAGLGADDSRILITVALTLGTLDEIKTAAPRSRAALSLLHRLVDELAPYDPAFVPVPAAGSADAQAAASLLAGGLDRLVTVG